MCMCKTIAARGRPIACRYRRCPRVCPQVPNMRYMCYACAIHVPGMRPACARHALVLHALYIVRHLRLHTCAWHALVCMGHTCPLYSAWYSHSHANESMYQAECRAQAWHGIAWHGMHACTCLVPLAPWELYTGTQAARAECNQCLVQRATFWQWLL